MIGLSIAISVVGAYLIAYVNHIVEANRNNEDK